MPDDRTPVLDKTDIQILDLMQRDATLSTQEIADAVSLSQSPCWRRIKRLQDAGYIKQQINVLDRKALGFNVVIFARVKLTAVGASTLSDFDVAIRKFPEVMECYTMLGETDYLLKIVTADIESYEAFYRERLSQLEGVEETNSMFVMTEIKNTHKLQLQSQS